MSKATVETIVLIALVLTLCVMAMTWMTDAISKSLSASAARIEQVTSQ